VAPGPAGLVTEAGETFDRRTHVVPVEVAPCAVLLRYRRSRSVPDALAAFGLVFLAELGDKSMLLAIALAARYRPWPVLGGISVAAFLMLGVATLVGTALGVALPERALAIGGGLLFVGFGLWTLRTEDADEEVDDLPTGSVLLGVTVAFLIAELGDKTMLATAALASTREALPTWLGAGAGMTVASGIAIGVTGLLGSRLPRRAVHLAAAFAFLAFGMLLLLGGIRR
jgi:Ca2+/H+ antiporter, TMEM165/GDT1 family